jgi:hypothetical protein
MLNWSRIENPLGAIVGVGFVIFLAVVGARSQPPTPAPREQSKQIQGQSAQEEQTTSDNHRGTDQEPFVVKIAPAQEPAAESKHPAENTNNEAADNHRLVIYTLLIALFTALLFLATSAQAIILFYQFQQARREARERSRAIIRPAFPTLMKPDAPHWDVVVVAQNGGPGSGVLTKMVAKFSEVLPSTADYLILPGPDEKKDTATILHPGQPFIYTFRSPFTTNGQFCYGYFRWNDGLGRRQYRFCMRVWAEGTHPLGHDHFHQTGGDEYNREEAAPET